MAQRGMADPRARRLVTVAILFLAGTPLALLCLLVALPLSALEQFAPQQNSRSRGCLFVATLIAFEQYGVIAAACLIVWHAVARPSPADRARHYRALQRGWAVGLYRSFAALTSMKIEVEGDALESAGANKQLWFVRHASFADTVVPFMVSPFTPFRYVLKAELLLDPCLDIVGHQLPNVFVRRGSDDPSSEADRVAALVREMGTGEAVVVFPEGTRFTESRRDKLLRRLAARAEEDDVIALARQLRHSLPPLRRGALAAIEAAEDTDLVIVGHVGLDVAFERSKLHRGVPMNHTLRIHLQVTPAADIPDSREAARAFLADRWLAMDTWVASTKERNASRDATEQASANDDALRQERPPEAAGG